MTCQNDRHQTEIHDLKSWPEYFKDVVRGLKTVELRQNDRGYQEGDLLCLREWQPAPPISSGVSPAWGGRYTGRLVLVKVTHILVGSGPIETALPEGWIAMSISLLYDSGGKEFQIMRRLRKGSPDD
jgi:hypothetical protein